jgi:NAD(P)H-hydrate epimerase
LRERYGGIVILKGAGSIIADGALPGVIAAGNPGMASGGMGDVLTGVVAGLAAQGFELGDAARYGACIHAVAADRAAAAGERGLLAHDLMAHLRALVNVGG